MSIELIHVKAFAKLNLFLNVVGRNTEYPGKHNLESVMIKLSSCNGEFGLYDDLSLRLAESWECSIEYDNDNISRLDDSENIVLKSGKKLLEKAREDGRWSNDMPPAAHVSITKRIPIGGGLGGGSADAAQTLKGLNKLWSLGYSAAELNDIGGELGADIPFALSDSLCCLVTGVGEQLLPVQLDMRLHILLFNPNKSLSTGDVFELYAKTSSFSDMEFNGKSSDVNPLSKESLTDRIMNGHNDLQAAAVSLLPEISQAMSWIDGVQGCEIARMSGSGATCFAIFDCEKNCELAMNVFKERYPDWWLHSINVDV